MKTILALIVVALANGAVLAQTPQASRPSPPDLKSEEVSWQPVYPAFVMGNLFPQTSSGSFPRAGVSHAQLKLEITEVVYGDGTVWRLADVTGKTE